MDRLVCRERVPLEPSNSECSPDASIAGLRKCVIRLTIFRHAFQIRLWPEARAGIHTSAINGRDFMAQSMAGELVKGS